MKSRILFILLICLGLSFQSTADTDISLYDNVLYLTPQTAVAGTQQYVISVKLKNKVGIAGFQFWLHVPEGITYSLDKDKNSLVSISSDRTTTSRVNGLSTGLNSDGDMGVVCYSLNKNNETNKLWTFDGNDGEVIKIPIDISADFTPGIYPIKILRQRVVDADGKAVGIYDETESTLTVTAPENRTVLDENSVTAPVASAGAVDVRVNRTVNANEWSTICLPFDMTEAQLKTAFGDDVRLAKFKDWSSEFVNEDDEYASSITINFASVTSLSANTPYIIKTSKDIKTFTVDGVTIAPATVEQTYGSKKRANYAAFHGTYEANRTLDDGVLFLSGGKFWYSVGKTVTKAFRCYLDLLFTLDYKNSVSSAKVNYRVDNTATNIHGINIATMNSDKVYSLSGRLMGEAGKITSLPKGVYIKNGKKIVVK